MARSVPPRPRAVRLRRTFAIVASQFNAQYVQGLVDHAARELSELAPSATVSVHRVPGSFEIPVVVRELARKKNAEAIIACGVIMQGETNHAKNLSSSVTDALQRIAVDYGVPVINVVLSFENDNQARERCLKNKINRGTEGARAAVEIAGVMSKFRGK
ncbi:MAG TPA: 6,7-dimethyl-8-ribityllumazine synthase [Candidatus Udaeobacter sp.]|jgi:6,7-dimethyl-8-ribityllumazine synthase|nr:6,7-dimethyl-8-ribityllumazine synthase [Candidatus Udaeobacter sp.]